MRAVVQRVSRASVTVEGRVVGAIGRGLLVFAAVEPADGPAELQYIVSKVRDLRVFADPDDPGKAFDKSVVDVAGAVLAVSQFTLTADCRKGRRPSFDGAASPQVARPVFERFVQLLRETGLDVATGEFQAMMQVDLVNDGPATFLLDSGKRF